MKNGDMLKKLHEVENILPELLSEHINTWGGIDIDYEPPRVERLYRQWGNYRISLHRIYPCEKALYHPHPWPSAIRIIQGRYEMGIAYEQSYMQTEPYEPTPARDSEIAKMVIGQGVEYEMIHEDGWHYVRPIGGPCLSLMVTGPPNDLLASESKQFGKGLNHGVLSLQVKEEIHHLFRCTYNGDHNPWYD